eukprot:1199723-Rhodomonas_salina.2
MTKVPGVTGCVGISGQWDGGHVPMPERAEVLEDARADGHLFGDLGEENEVSDRSEYSKHNASLSCRRKWCASCQSES